MTAAAAYMTLLGQLPSLLNLYWVLCTGAVVVTLLPLPVPEAFRCVGAAPCRPPPPFSFHHHHRPAALGR